MKMLYLTSNTIIQNGRHSFLYSNQILHNIDDSSNNCSDKVVTASFDKSLKLWSSANGICLRTFIGHTAEVVASEFSHSNSLLVSASMDKTARVFDIETGLEMNSFFEHDGEVIAAHFHRNDNIILTASFDSNARLFDLRSNE